jgi:hypothetical protein
VIRWETVSWRNYAASLLRIWFEICTIITWHEVSDDQKWAPPSDTYNSCRRQSSENSRRTLHG